MNFRQEYEKLQLQLKQALLECERLREENKKLKEIASFDSADDACSGSIDSKDILCEERNIYTENQETSVHKTSSPEKKIALFRSLFQGRVDVYAVRWESKNGKSGYSPACANEWDRIVCKKPMIKCSDCQHRKLMPLTDEVIYHHLAGKHTVGMYPLLHDETCLFLAIDFDKNDWQKDALAFFQTCNTCNVPAVVERSRSGKGAHVWIFFDTPVSASLARNLGSALLTKTMEERYELTFDSYDRFFPNQDTMPKGGFGNLIALPLQGESRKAGNNVFVDEHFQPYDDQWAFLSTIRKIKEMDVQAIISSLIKHGHVTGIQDNGAEDGQDDMPWNASSTTEAEQITGSLPEKVRIIQSDLLYVEKIGLSSAMLNRLKRLAAFQNPEFYKAQAMRLSTFDKPRIIGCAEEHPKHIALPRGCLDTLLRVLHEHSIKTEVVDERYSGEKIDACFQGELYVEQKEAVKALLAHEIGILSATTAFGKTVVAAAIIAERKVNTLILVHRKELMEQWRERLAAFLDIPLKEIGQIGGGKQKRTGHIDIAVMQSLSRKGIVKDSVAEYGQVIVDECHHLSAYSFEQILKKVKARYVLGLTATLIRKDGHHPIITMQCGPVLFRADAKVQAQARPFEHIIVPRITRFTPKISNMTIQEIYAELIEDEQRNEMIFDDVLMALEQGRRPLLLTERTAHVDYFANRLKGFAKNVIVLRGGMGKKQREAIKKQMSQIPDSEERMIIATGRYIGEGFDDPSLDTLFLVMPISWKGTLQQYAGRLHRIYNHKKDVKIYDYVDENVLMLMRMYEKRLKGYAAMGYRLEGEGEKERKYAQVKMNL